MTTPEIIAFSLLEIISVLLVIRLWRVRRRMRLWRRCFWSAVLLLPLIGPIVYGFVLTDPELHEDEPPEADEPGRQLGSAPDPD